MMKKVRLVSVVFFLWYMMSSVVITGYKYEQHELQIITTDNLKRLSVIASYDAPSISQLAWSNDGMKLALSSTDNVFLFDTSTMELQTINEIKGDIQAIRFKNSTYNLVILRSSDVLLYDPEKSKLETILTNITKISNLSSDGTIYAQVELTRNSQGDVTAEDIEVYNTFTNDFITGFSVNLLEKPCTYLCSVRTALTPDNLALITAAQVPYVESAIFDITSDRKLVVQAENLGGGEISFNYDGSIIVFSAGEPGYLTNELIFVNRDTGDIVRRLEIFNTSTPAFDRYNNILVVGQYDETAPNPDESIGKLSFYDVHSLLSNDLTTPLQSIGFAGPILFVSFSPNNRFIIAIDIEAIYVLGIN
jgi:WD40 repeat protein